MNNLLALGLTIVLWVFAIIPLMMFLLSRTNMFYTRISSNEIKFIMRGKTIIRILHNVPGKILRIKMPDGSREIPSPNNLDLAEFFTGEETRGWLQKRFGIFWVGIWPFDKILTFEISKEEENPRGSTIADWIIDNGSAPVDSLRYNFPRPFIHQNVELGGRTTVDFITATKLRVVRPYIPVVQLKGNFFTNTYSILSSAVNNLTKGIETQDQFADADKSEGEKSYLHKLKVPDGELNIALAKQVGLALDGISIPKYDPSDSEVRAAMQLAEIATLKKEALKIDAEAYAMKIGIETTADKQRLLDLAVGKEADIKARLQPLIDAKATSSELKEAFESMLEAEMLKDTKLSTYVKGGKAKPVIPVK